MSKKIEEELSYREAAEEIDRILGQIESEAELDVDELADKVERASGLIGLCFDRLKRAGLRINKVSEDLARTAKAADSDPNEDPEAE